MPLPRGLPIVDHHCHLSPSGEGVEAARRFRAVGGTHLFLATQNYEPGTPRSVDDYRRQFETTEALARRVHEESGVTVYPVIAPYPIDLVAAGRAIGLGPALEVHRASLDLAGQWVRERRAVALGEVGRAHFPVSEAEAGAIESAFRHAFEVARDVGCPLVVHSADLDAAGFAELNERAREAGLAPEKVVKHYARERRTVTELRGIAPSYVARRELVNAVVSDPAPWFLETDFLDDPRRPGAVLDLETVPRRARAIAERADGSPDRLFVPFVDSVERVYGWRPECPEGTVP
ncbi:MAG TPA: TatD family hydrolase [Thermoplasmata archaeon]|nr:TatD family hydrolase [Thermoplasmata archaeon]